MIYIFIAMFFYATAILLISAASRSISPTLTAGLSNAIGAIIPMAIAAPLFNKQTFQNHRLGVLLALLGGICIAIFAMAVAKSYSINKVAVVAPIVFGGAILLSAVVSIGFLKAKATATELVGLATLVIGLAIITYARATGK